MMKPRFYLQIEGLNKDGEPFESAIGNLTWEDVLEFFQEFKDTGNGHIFIRYET